MPFRLSTPIAGSLLRRVGISLFLSVGSGAPGSVVVMLGGGLVPSRVPLLTLWAAVCQAPLSMGSLQAGILEWVVISSSRGSSRLRDQTLVSVTGRWVLYPRAT